MSGTLIVWSSYTDEWEEKRWVSRSGGEKGSAWVVAVARKRNDGPSQDPKRQEEVKTGRGNQALNLALTLKGSVKTTKFGTRK